MPLQTLILSNNSFSGPLPSVDPTWITQVALDGNQFTAPGGCLGLGCDLYAYASNMVAFTLDGNPLNVSVKWFLKRAATVVTLNMSEASSTAATSSTK